MNFIFLFALVFIASIFSFNSNSQTIPKDVLSGKLAYAAGQIELAKKTWTRAANLGNSDALYYLGNLYVEARNSSLETLKALDLFHKAATKGNLLAALELAALLEDKPAVTQYGNSKDWYAVVQNGISTIEAKAKSGDPFAQSALGFMYGFGKGAPQDTTKYVFWQKKAADQGFPIAAYHLGHIYETGFGVKKDARLSAKLVKEAALQGLIYAQEMLGRFYRDGVGLVQNKETAEYWYKKSAKKNLYSSALALADIYLNSGRKKEASSLILQAEQIVQSTYGTAHRYYAEVQFSLARLYLTTEKSGEARALLKSVISIYEAEHGKDVMILINPLLRLCDAYSKAGEISKTKPILDRASRIVLKHRNSSHPDYAVIVEYQAGFSHAIGDAQKARKLYQRAINIYENNFGLKHNQIAKISLTLAGIIDSIGDPIESEKFYTRSINIYTELFGKNHPNVIQAKLQLASFYKEHFQFKKSLVLFNDTYASALSLQPKNNAQEANILSKRAEVLIEFGKSEKAEKDLKESIKIAESFYGRSNASTSVFLLRLAKFYKEENRLEESEFVTKEALKRTKGGGPGNYIQFEILMNLIALGIAKDDPKLVDSNIANLLNGLKKENVTNSFLLGSIHSFLSAIYLVRGQTSKATILMKKAASILERHYGHDNPKFAKILMRWSSSIYKQGDKKTAAELEKRAMKIFTSNLSESRPELVFEILPALSYLDENIAVNKKLIARSEKILANVFGKDHPKFAEFLLLRAKRNYGISLRSTPKNFSAKPNKLKDLQLEIDETDRKLKSISQQKIRDIVAALKILEKRFGLNHYRTLPALEALSSEYAGVGYSGSNLLGKAEQLLERIVSVSKTLYGSGSARHAESIGNLANFYSGNSSRLGVDSRFNVLKALALQNERLDIVEAIFGDEHIRLTYVLSSINFLNKRLKNFGETLVIARRNSKIVRLRQDLLGFQLERTETFDFGSMKTVVSSGENRAKHSRGRGVFEDHVKSALNLALTGDRTKREKEAFVALQLARTSRAADAIRKVSARFSARNNEIGILIRNLQDNQKKRSEIDLKLVKEYAKEAKARDEDLTDTYRSIILTMNGEIKALKNKISKEFPRYFELTQRKPTKISDIQALLGENEALVTTFGPQYRGTYVFVVRKNRVVVHNTGIDGNFKRKRIADNIKSIRKGLDLSRVTKPSDLLDFDIQAAYLLYKQTIGSVSSALGGVDHLIFVPGRKLQSIPISLMVTEKPISRPSEITDFRKISWLYKKYAISTLPSISSFLSLRKNSKKSLASRPFIGFGDPKINSSSGASHISLRSTSSDRVVPDVREIGDLDELPETSGELNSIARYLGADHSSVITRENATEKKLRDTELHKYRVLAFATHGLTGGEIDGLEEPALVLTPALGGRADGDGLLTASEITELKLDSDWVILSACNTASGENEQNEILSGLGRAFLYAGSRALLVSHWPVESNSATELTVGIFKELRENPHIGRAEALKRSMEALASNDNNPHYSHPVFWAPFVVVGDGLGAR